MSRPPILLGEHRLLSEKINKASDESQEDRARQEYANELRKAGESDAANLVGNFDGLSKAHEALCHISERVNKALLSLSGNQIGGSVAFVFYDEGAIGLELTFLTTTPGGDFVGPYPESTRLSEAQISWVNALFQPLTETAGKLMKEAGHPLQYRPEVESYHLSFSTCEIPLITEYLEREASGWE